MSRDESAKTKRTSPGSRTNLRRLFVLRCITIVGQATAVVVTTGYLGIPLPTYPLAVIITSLALINLAIWFRLHWRWQVTEPEFFLHVLIDTAALIGLLYFSGGAANPFVLLLLVPLTITAMVLPRAYTWALTVIVALSYTLLMWSNVPLPHAHTGMGAFGLHLFGMWLAFVLSAGIIAYFVVGMGETLRKRERALSAARERVLRDEQLVALGTLAASAAHELSTPLGTMALVADELAEECLPGDPDNRMRLQTLRDQIDRCTNVLSTLAASAGGLRVMGGQAMPADRFLEQVLSEWRQSRPGVDVEARWNGHQPAPLILADRTLTQSLINILDNAAQASPAPAEWDAVWDSEALSLEIRDRGPGLTPEASASAGRIPYSSKSGGLGLGLFLSHAIIERLGGTVRLYNRKGGGLCTEIRVPFTELSREQSA